MIAWLSYLRQLEYSDIQLRHEVLIKKVLRDNEMIFYVTIEAVMCEYLSWNITVKYLLVLYSR